VAGPPPRPLGDAGCPRCLEFEEEIRELHQRLAAVGQYVTYTPGPSPNPNVERELQRWLAVNPRADAAAGFRAGWARLARFVGPRLPEWEARWFRSMRDKDRLRARVGSLLRELSRLNDRG
jgi:hypothetical protein